MANLPKWTEERTNQLKAFVGDESPVSQETVAKVAVELETTNRSISSKLRKIGYEVELVANSATKTFTEEEADALASFVEDNTGVYTYGEIAEAFAEGKFTAKQVQGKILSLELTGAVKPTPKPESVRTYTPEEEATFLEMAREGAFLEEIADALGKEVPSVRGKALSFLRSEELESIPKQRDVVGKKQDGLESLGDVSEETVESLAEKLGKTPRGVRTMLTRRGITIADYDGAAKKAKASA